MPDPQHHQLDYAQPDPWHRRSAFRRWFVSLGLLAAVIFAGYRWGSPAWRQVQLYVAQRQCMSYVAPPKQLIYATDPNPDHSARTDAKASKAPPPKCWVVLNAVLPEHISLLKPAKVYLDGPFEPLAPAPVFMHRRISSGGKQQLVVVLSGEQCIGGKGHSCVLCCRVIDPATLFHGPVLLWQSSTIIVGSFDGSPAVKVYAGSADDTDPSHFTISVDVEEGTKFIDGWLQDDDTVKVQVRESPAKEE